MAPHTWSIRQRLRSWDAQLLPATPRFSQKIEWWSNPHSFLPFSWKTGDTRWWHSPLILSPEWVFLGCSLLSSQNLSQWFKSLQVQNQGGSRCYTRLLSHTDSKAKPSRSVGSDSLWPRGLCLPGSSVHGISQARILEWVAISFSRRSSQPRDRTQVSHVAGRRFTLWAIREAPHTNVWL